MEENFDQQVDQFFEQNPGGYGQSEVPAGEILSETMAATPDQEAAMREAQLNQPENAPMQGPDLENDGQPGQMPSWAQKGIDFINNIGMSAEEAMAAGAALTGQTPEQVENNWARQRDISEAGPAGKAIKEISKPLGGAPLQALEGAGEFAELVGDTTKTALNAPGVKDAVDFFGFSELVGPLNPADDVFSNQYEAADWDLGSSMYADTESGKAAQSILAFGLTLYATGGLSGASGLIGAVKAVKAGQGIKGIAQAYGMSGAVRGALADLIVNPDEGNFSNMIESWIPGMKDTWLTALATDKGANPWINRIKTAGEGMIMSEVADFAIALAFGRKAGKAVLDNGGTIDEAVDAMAEATAVKAAEAPPRPLDWPTTAKSDENIGYFLEGPRQGVDNLDPIMPELDKLAKGESTGFTLSPDGKPPTDGYMVAIDASEPLTDFSPEGIAGWLTDNAGALTREDAFIGGWISDITGKPVIEVSRNVPDLAEAVRLGKAFDQEAIFNVRMGNFLDTGGQDLMKKTKNIGFDDLNAKPTPKRIFHGTTPKAGENIRKVGFKKGSRSSNLMGEGVYFADDASYAKGYGQDLIDIDTDQLNILDLSGKSVNDFGDEIGIGRPSELMDMDGNLYKSPEEIAAWNKIDPEDRMATWSPEQMKKLQEWAKTSGYDGIHYNPDFAQKLSRGMTSAPETVVFNPEAANRAMGMLPKRPDNIRVGNVSSEAINQTIAAPAAEVGMRGRGDGILTDAGYYKIGASPDGDKYIKQVVESNPELQRIANESGRSVEEIVEEAEEIVKRFNGDVDGLPGFQDQFGTKVLTDSATVATKTMIKSMADDLADTAYALVKANDAGMNLLPNADKTVMQLKSLLRAHKYTSRHYGRGLNTFKIPGLNAEIPNPFKNAQLTPEQIQKGIEESDKTLDSILDGLKAQDPEARLKALMLANQLVMADGDPALMRNATRWMIGTGFSDALGMFYNSILSGPATHIVNTTSSAMNMVYRPAAAMLGSFFTENGQITRQAAAASFSNVFQDISESFEVARRVLLTNAPVNDGTKTLVRQSDTARAMDLLRKSAENSNDMGFKAGVNFLDMFHSLANSPVIDWPSRLMTTTDEFFKTMVGRMEWRNKSMREALTKAGGSMDEAKKLYEGVLEANAKKMFDESTGAIMDKEILDAAKEVTFQTELKGAAKSFGDFVNAFPPARIFFPFVKTGHNVMVFAFEHLPVLGQFTSEYKAVMAGTDEAAKAMMKGRQAFGSMIIAAGGLGAMTGTITGNGPADPDLRREWLKNNKPRSIKIPGTDKWFDYSRLEPFNMILAGVADVAYAFENNQLQEKDATQLMGQLTYAISANLTQRSYFAGLVPLGQLLSPGSQGLKQLETIPVETLNSFLPYSGARRTFANLMNPYMMEFKDEMDRLKFQASAGLVNNGVNMPDFLNGELTNSSWAGGNAIFPYKVQEQGVDPVRDELENIGYETSEIETRGQVKLSPEMKAQVARHMGTHGLHAELKRLINSKAYKAMKDQAKEQVADGNPAPKRSFRYYKEINKVIDKHRDNAISELYHTNNDFRYEFDTKQKQRTQAGLKPQSPDNSNYINLENLMNDPLR